jgi:hypothetical protein
MVEIHLSLINFLGVNAVNDIIEFNVSDAAISELSTQYSNFVLSDKTDYKIADHGRKLLKGYRVSVEKRRKEFTADALDYQRRVNKEARRITALLEPIEYHLQLEQKKFDDEVERVRKEKEEEENNRLQKYVDKLLSFEFRQNMYHFDCAYTDKKISLIELKLMSNDDINKMLNHISTLFDVEIERRKEIERIQTEQKEKQDLEDKKERDRLTLQRREQELEAERLADIARDQEAKQKIIDDELSKVKVKTSTALHEDKFSESKNVSVNTLLSPEQHENKIIEEMSEYKKGFDDGYKKGWQDCVNKESDALNKMVLF